MKNSISADYIEKHHCGSSEESGTIGVWRVALEDCLKEKNCYGADYKAQGKPQ